MLGRKNRDDVIPKFVNASVPIHSNQASHVLRRVPPGVIAP
ncbi:hypothetical protein RRSWK_01697 [Rhodopirellula sp. SWK7]|nr:hypothetical protein RRSWK_01697 [Rhodopirellula sp. SWK7]